LKKKFKYPKVFKDDKGTVYENYKKAANAFNDHFIESVSDVGADNICSKDHSSVTGTSNRIESMFLGPLTVQEVVDIIKGVSHKDSSGIDEIPCSMLTHIIDLIANPLANLINASFCEGIFTSKLKTSKVIPVKRRALMN